MNELQISYNGSATLYAILRRMSDAYAWNGAAWEPWDDTHVATYAIALTPLGGDLYGADMPDLDPDNYRVFYYVQAGASPATTDLLRESDVFRWNGTTQTVVSGGASWTYSDESRFNLWNQSDATSIEDFGSSTVLQAAGERGDAYIDSGLAGLGFTVPLANMDTRTSTLLEDVSNHAARWQLAEARQWNVTQGGKPDDATKALLRDKKYVDDFLAKVEEKPGMITADGTPSIGTSTGGISVFVGAPKQYPGTGHRRPAAVTLPALPTPWSW